MDITDPTLASLRQKSRQNIMVAFAIAVSTGDNLKGLDTVSPKSTENYLSAAASWATDAELQDPRFSYDHLGHRTNLKAGYCPDLKKWMDHCCKYAPGKSDALPLTRRILDDLHNHAASSANTGQQACIRDACTLGTYTGSRCSEYCRGRPGPSSPFMLIPTSHITTTQAWAGLPIAFIADDFTFLDSNQQIIHWTSASTLATYVQIRFRFDKGGGHNFSTRTFKRFTTCVSLCPVLTCVRIIVRWNTLSGDATVPVMCFSSGKGKLSYLSDTAVTAAIRASVRRSYPPTHIFITNICKFRTHSLRVTACLYLSAAGLAESIIEYKLRWASAAWKGYLRESFAEIDSTAMSVFAQANTDNQPTDTPIVHHHTLEDLL